MLAQAASQPSIDALIEAVNGTDSASGLLASILSTVALAVAIFRPQLSSFLLDLLRRPPANGSNGRYAPNGNGQLRDELSRAMDGHTATVVRAVDRSGERIENAIARLIDATTEKARHDTTVLAKIEATLDVLKAMN